MSGRFIKSSRCVAIIILLNLIFLPVFAGNFVGIWELNEAPPIVVDSSGAGNNGTPENIVQGLPGIDGSSLCVEIPGTGAGISIPDSDTLDLGDDFSIQVSVFPTTLSAGKRQRT